MSNFFGFVCVFGTVFCTVYGQIVLKWRISRYGDFPDSLMQKIVFMATLFKDFYILSGLASAFVASLFWMAAMTKFDVSFAYPFTSFAFVLVLGLSILLLNEPFSWHKLLGVIFIAAGIIISASGENLIKR